MKIFEDGEARLAESRVTFLRLVGLQLRLMEMWRDAAGGYQEAVVQMAVGAINGDYITRSPARAPSRNMGNAVPMSLQTKCNLSSISAATGLNRETVRRVVNRLIVNGPLVRSSDGSINFIGGWSQGMESQRLAEAQFNEFCRTVNLLLRDSALSAQD